MCVSSPFYCTFSCDGYKIVLNLFTFLAKAICQQTQNFVKYYQIIFSWAAQPYTGIVMSNSVGKSPWVAVKTIWLSDYVKEILLCCWMRWKCWCSWGSVRKLLPRYWSQVWWALQDAQIVSLRGTRLGHCHHVRLSRGAHELSPI